MRTKLYIKKNIWLGKNFAEYGVCLSVAIYSLHYLFFIPGDSKVLVAKDQKRKSVVDNRNILLRIEIEISIIEITSSFLSPSCQPERGLSRKEPVSNIFFFHELIVVWGGTIFLNFCVKATANFVRLLLITENETIQTFPKSLILFQHLY